jgi:hypothetical protein
MKKIIAISLFLSTLFGGAQSLSTFYSKTDAFLKANVSNGKVAYSKIHDNPSELDEILNIAKTITVSKNDAKNYKSFWINAYNLSVIKGLVDHYPTESPLNQAGFFDKTKHSLGGKQITLNDIENKLLRGQFNDARFHFVLVCGAVGCPPLINKAYLPSTLNAQLEAQTKKAINGNFIQVDEKKKRVKVSQIMEWYKGDFKTKDSDEIDFINKYRNEKLEGKYKLSYFTYNWNINKQ